MGIFNEVRYYLGHSFYSANVSLFCSKFCEIKPMDSKDRNGWKWTAINIGILATTIFAEFYLAKVCLLSDFCFSLATVGAITGIMLSVLLSIHAILALFPYNSKVNSWPKPTKEVLPCQINPQLVVWKYGPVKIQVNSEVDSIFIEHDSFLKIVRNLSDLGVSYIFLMSASDRLDGMIETIDCSEVQKEQDFSKRFICFITVQTGEAAGWISGAGFFIKKNLSISSTPYFHIQIKEHNNKHTLFDLNSFEFLKSKIPAFRKNLKPENRPT